jgi:hypothetical protein
VCLFFAFIDLDTPVSLSLTLSSSLCGTLKHYLDSSTYGDLTYTVYIEREIEERDMNERNMTRDRVTGRERGRSNND